MPRQLVIILIILMALSSTAQADTGDIVVTVENLRNLNQGELQIALFEKMDRVEMDFTKALRVQSVRVTSAKLSVTFSALPYGDYAIGVLHDLNKDKKMETNWIGMPKEDLAVSNNAKGGPMGGPKWDKAKFTLNTKKLILAPIVISHM
ncbi:MAG: DUF2141 domain-containing protein [Deltaproteobacteria bacterium]|jgi:uncharacterized protein (DUF2141 family)|nr:DUF2141 domain-containing protein [Deltaproteobacteria bacterium]MBT6490995.1 DUF2141 domain-containing protein [Deltaproteobacteria bacterium]